MMRYMKTSRQQSGTSLLEVLIAVVILSIGLLGLAGLQVASLRVNQGAMQRSQATIFAYDVLDLMRGDRIAAIDGEYDVFVTKDGHEIPVTSSSIASDYPNLKEWATELAKMLPGSDAMICRTNDPASMNCVGTGEFFIVEVRWPDENDRGSDAMRQTISVLGQL